MHPKKPMRRLIFVFLTVLISGCSVAKQLSDGHIAYNEAVRLSSDQEILLNIVRLRYLEPMEFLAITAINSTVSFSAELDLTAGRADGANAFSGEAIASYSNSPTFSFVPQRGDDFSDRMIQPVDVETLIVMASEHHDPHTVFRLFVNWMNGLNNQEGLVDDEFIEVTRDLTHHLFKGTVLFGFREKDRVISPPIAPGDLTPAQIVQAHNAGLQIRKLAGSDDLQFTVTDRQPMLSINRNSPDLPNILSGLQLDPNVSAYPIVSQAEFKEEMSKGELAVRTRSLLHSLSFLSQGVDVPPEDLESGAATSPWPHAAAKPVRMGDMFRVRYSKDMPDKASLAVRFRDRWYYIDRTDAASRRTFLLLSEAFRFTLNSNADQAPTLTFPVGGGAD